MPATSSPRRSTPALNAAGRSDFFSLRSVVILILGTSLLWASAKVQVPFWPVPITLQTYVVLSLGALFGWRLGAATVAAYLLEGAIGLPVFAGTPSHGLGLAYMAGPTGGYLAGYLVAAAVVGLLLEQRANRGVLSTALAVGIGELIILGLGCAWLAVQVGWNDALALGFGPFLIGDAAKLAAAIATAIYARPLIAADAA